MYSLLFKAASQTLSKLALDPKFLGAQIGVTMVLHTWEQNLSFHPHVHCIVPGGGLSPSGCSFLRSKKKFIIPVKVLSKVFRGKFLLLLKQAFHQQQLAFTGESHFYEEVISFSGLLDSLYEKDWVVYCKKPFKTPHHVVQYLSRYTHKTAIYNNRIEVMDEHSVTFRYRDYKTEGKVKTMKLDAMEFIRRFMLLSNCNRKTKLRKCLRLNRVLIKCKVKLTAQELIMKVTGKDISICSSCGGHWYQVLTLQPDSS